MTDDRQVEDAQWLPFSRSNMAAVLDIPLARLNNWLDRNRLWQTERGPNFHRSYALREVFDIGGFAAMRLAKIPETHCARYVYSFGFIGAFWHNDQQVVNFDFRKDGWSFGSHNLHALLVITINVRTLGEEIFRKLSELTSEQPDKWPKDAFESFRLLYIKAVELGCLWPGTAPIFETASELTT